MLKEIDGDESIDMPKSEDADNSRVLRMFRVLAIVPCFSTLNLRSIPFRSVPFRVLVATSAGAFRPDLLFPSLESKSSMPLSK